MGHPLFARKLKHSDSVENWALEQQMYDGGPWNRTVTGSKASVENHRDGRLQTNPNAKLRIVKV